MILGAESFLSELRARFRPTGGIFALNFGGTRHNILTTPALAAALFAQKSSHVDAEQITFGLMRNIFGFPGREARQYEEALPELMACYMHLTTEPHLGALAASVAQDLQREAANLVTFNESPVDQMPWERAADVELRTTALGESVVEASLLPLVRDFCAHLANRALFGADLLANFPDLLADMWALDRGFFLLATGLSRFVPIPGLPRAHLARRRLLQHFETYHAALAAHFEPDGAGRGHRLDAKWSGLPTDVGALIRSRLPVYAKHGLSLRARAACELALLWAANANSHTLVFWMLNHLYADRELLARIREEIAPYVEVAGAQRHAGVPLAEPPRITRIDRDGLCQRCPLLKSIYIECLRLDTASWSLKVVKQDAVLVSRGEKGAAAPQQQQQQQQQPQAWQLRKGDYVHAAHDLHNTDPVYFPDPAEWRADRHVKIDPETGAATAEIGSIRPYGEWSLPTHRYYHLFHWLTYILSIFRRRHEHVQGPTARAPRGARLHGRHRRHVGNHAGEGRRVEDAET